MHSLVDRFLLPIARTLGNPACRLLLPTLALIYCVVLKGAQYFSFKIDDFDVGIYSNLAWNFSQGNGFFSSVLARNHFGEHFSPIMIPLSLFYLFLESPLVVLMAQGLAAGITFFLIYRLASVIFDESLNRHITLAGSLFCLTYFFYKPFHSALAFQFHPSTLAIPIVAGAILALHNRNNLLLYSLVGLLLMTKENATLAVASIGLYAWFVLGHRGTCLILLGIATTAGLFIFKVFMPTFQNGSWGHYSRLGPTEHLGAKAMYLSKLVLPLMLLPLLKWRALLPALPLILLNLSVRYKGQFSLKFHYDDMASILLLIAAMHGMNTLVLHLRDSHGLKKFGEQAPALIVLVLLLPILASSPIRTVTKLVRSLPNNEHLAIMDEVRPYIDCEADVGIVAQSNLGPYLSCRPRYASLASRRSLTSVRKGDLLILSDTIKPKWYPHDEAINLLREKYGLELVHSGTHIRVFRII